MDASLWIVIAAALLTAIMTAVSALEVVHLQDASAAKALLILGIWPSWP